jgi:hypothetical protein
MLDGINLVKTYTNKLNIKNIYVLVDTKESLQFIKNKVNIANPNLLIEFIYVFIDIINHLQTLISKINNNFILNISSHGYCTGNSHNYINFNGKIINDCDFHDCLNNNLTINIFCLIFVDTCQSGSMFNLNYKTKNLSNYSIENMSDSTLNIYCIGAVDDNEYDQDDLSEFGYGGGLTCALIDYFYEYKTFDDNLIDIKDFFLYYKNRIHKSGKHPTLSFNNLSFINNT